MNWKQILRSIIKTIFRILWKFFLLALWGCCEFLAVAFRALSAWLKNYITRSRSNSNN